MNFLVYSSTRPVDPLLVAGGAQGHGDQGLGLAPLEQGRAVHPGQHVDLAGNLPQGLVVASVGPGAGEDQVADHDLLQLVPDPRQNASSQTAPSASGSGITSASAFCFSALTASARACLPSVRLASRKSA